MIYCRFTAHPYNVGTILGPMLVQCSYHVRTMLMFVQGSYDVRAMFVQCSYNVRTMAKKVHTMFVQSTTKVRRILFELLAIVRTLCNIVP